MVASPRLPPGSSSPVFVQHWRYAAEPHVFLRELHAQHGDAFTMRVLSHPPVVVLADPDAVREVFTGSPDDLYAGEGNRLIEGVVGKNSLLLLDGPRHLRERRLLVPPFHGERMQAYGDIMREISENTIDAWPIGTPFAIQPHMAGITLDVILRTVFGVDDAARLQRLRQLMVQLVGDVTHPALFAAMLALPGDRLRRILTFGMEDGAPTWKRAISKVLPLRSVTEARVEIDHLLLAEIQHRRKHGTVGRSDVLSLLVDARHEDGSPMQDQELLDEMITLLLAGHETSAVSLAWLLQRVLERPAVLTQLRAEVQDVTAGGPLQAKDVAKLRYTDAVIREAMRFDTLLPLVVRSLQRDLRIAGWDLPAGTIVGPSPLLVHENPRIWSEPHQFRPERFLERKVPTYEWLPFGGGHRRCLGVSFALFEMTVVLATLVSRVDLRLASAIPPVARRRGVVIGPKGGVSVIVTGHRGPHAATEKAK
ncbi:MAG: cytochrome P450 [Myxococcales bacterium]|nr:cytochrome P450 [Myxococcales bacterium]